MTERKYSTFDSVDAAALCQPAVRMVVIEAWSNNGELGHQIIPVVAIKTVLGKSYQVDRKNCLPEMSDAKTMKEEGWEFTGDFERLEAICLGSEGLSTVRDLELTSNVKAQEFACPWPMEQDEEMLKEQIKELELAAKRREDYFRSKKETA